MTVHNITKRNALGIGQASFLTLALLVLTLFFGYIGALVAGYLGILPAKLLDMSIASQFMYAGAFGLIGMAIAVIIDLFTDIGFRRDLDIGEIIFGSIVGPIIAITLVKLGTMDITSLTQNLWLYGVGGTIHFLAKITIGK
jgi:hypothetical protein